MTSSESTSASTRIYVLVPCAGSGQRMGRSTPKQYLPLAGKALVAHTLAALAQVHGVKDICVVISPEDSRFHVHVPDFKGKVMRCGGSSRAETVRNGLQWLLERHGASRDDWVLVHDAARCMIQPAWVDRLIQRCLRDGQGGLLAVPVADTVKRAVERGTSWRVDHTVARSQLWLAQTPQMFHIGPLLDALQGAGDDVTDESSAMEHTGLESLLVMGDARNIKVTSPQDLAVAAVLLDALQAEAAAMTESTASQEPAHASPPTEPEGDTPIRVRRIDIRGTHIDVASEDEERTEPMPLRSEGS